MLSRQSLAEALRACSKNLLFHQGKLVHGAALRRGYGFDLLINNDLIDMYAKCSRTTLARILFDKMPTRNVVSWTALMCGYIQDGNAKESLLLLPRMVHSDAQPNEFTFSTNLKACGILRDIENGRQIHGFCWKSGFQWYPVVGNSLIDMYARCGKIDEAENIFYEMPDRGQITWNVMISGYALEGMGHKSLILFKQMQKHGETPDNFTFASTLKACAALRAIHEGTQIHAFLIVKGFPISGDKVISGALIELYVKSGSLNEAHTVFDSVLEKEKSIISWTTLIVGYAQEGSLMKALELFRELRESEIPMDRILLSSLMGVFADFALVELGKQLHSYSIKVPSGLETSVLNSVIDMYLKCGFIDEAERLFDDLHLKSVVSWTTMITGYGKYGLGRKAVELFKRMEEVDEVTYLAILTACSHSGLVQESQEYFTRLCNEPKLKPRVDHYSCLVDALGRAGRLTEAKALIENMPLALKPNTGIWQTMLSACRTHKNVEVGREVGEILLKMDGDNPTTYVMLSNLYADANHWKECEELRRVAKAKGLRKEAGQSWVEIGKKMQFFYNRDERHPETKAIHRLLKEMEKRMKTELGYAHRVGFSLHDVEEESREESLMFHSEKLAIGLALLSESGNEAKPIRVFKNLRVCGDCHDFIKGLSKILNKVFLVRDANRFHKFENGACSCGDYW